MSVLLSSCSVLTPIDNKKQAISPADSQAQPFLGVASRKKNLQSYGLKDRFGHEIIRVIPGSAAAAAGLNRGDIILRYDGRIVKKSDGDASFGDYIRSHKAAGEELILELLSIKEQINAEHNNQQLEVGDISAIPQLLQQLQTDSEMLIQILRKPRTVRVVAELGTRSDKETTEDNAAVYDRLQQEQSRVAETFQLLRDYYQLEQIFDDWKQAQEEDEHWDRDEQLPLVRYLRRRPMRADPLMNFFSEELLNAARKNDIDSILSQTDLMRSLEVAAAKQAALPPVAESLPVIVERAGRLQRKALSPLSLAEKEWLRTAIPKLLGHFQYAYDIGFNRGPEIAKLHRKVLKLARRLDPAAMSAALRVLLPLTDKQWLQELKADLLQRKPESNHKISAFGQLRFQADTAWGKIVVGGPLVNIYRGTYAMIIDLGGRDFYQNQNNRRGINILIDMGGDDHYSHQKDITQGAGVLGISLLVELSGDDHYQAINIAQGSAVMGEALVLDFSGNDSYASASLAQGSAFWGKGILIDFKGDDDYRGDHFLQGMGGTLGLGMIIDVAGDDRYFCGGRHGSSYRTSGIFRGSCQGFGVGFRYYAPGGIGIMLEGGGDDQAVAGNFSQGTGYYHGLGLLYDAGDGDDHYHASRYGLGAAAHAGVGVALMDGGNDRYSSSYGGVILGAAWDRSVAIFKDRAGDDIYGNQRLRFSFGSAAHGGFGGFIELSGKDRYFGNRHEARTGNQEIANIGLFLELGGKDDYISFPLSENNVLLKDRGKVGLLLDIPDFDRPLKLENLKGWDLHLRSGAAEN